MAKLHGVTVLLLQEDIDAESIATFNRRQMVPSARELAVSDILVLYGAPILLLLRSLPPGLPQPHSSQ